MEYSEKRWIFFFKGKNSDIFGFGQKNKRKKKKESKIRLENERDLYIFLNYKQALNKFNLHFFFYIILS